MFRFLFIAILCFYSSVSFSNDLIGLYENSSSRKPYIEFLARDYSADLDGNPGPGHAYIVIGEELDNGLLFQKGVFGLYPKDGKMVEVKLLFSTDGVITSKLPDILSPDFTYKVNVDDEQLKLVEKVLLKWKTKKYSLLNNNCSKLASEVAKVIGLKLPAGILEQPNTAFPIDYMKALEKENR